MRDEKVSKMMFADTNVSELVKMFKQKDIAKKALEKELAKLKEAICIELGDNDTLVNSDGEIIATWIQSNPVTRFDKDKLAEEMPDVYSKYVYKGDPIRTFLAK